MIYFIVVHSYILNGVEILPIHILYVDKLVKLNNKLLRKIVIV